MPWLTSMALIYVVDDENDSVLLLYSPEEEKWLPVRGALHDHELPEEAALRLVKEQLNVKAKLVGARSLFGEHVRLTDPVAMLNEHVDARHEHLQFVFAARIAEPVHEDVHWIDARWFSREDLKAGGISESVRLCAGLALEASRKEIARGEGLPGEESGEGTGHDAGPDTGEDTEEEAEGGIWR